MKAKEFEKICLARMEREEVAGRATMCRYGVQASFHKMEGSSESGWRPLQSLPDFEGILLGGLQFIFDCKVCGAASFPLDESKFKKRQLRHMLTRSHFGAICFLLIHFTERHLVKSIEPPQTWAFPISGKHPFWISFNCGEVKRITRDHCREFAAAVPWNVCPGGRTPRPDILSAIRNLS